MFNEVFMKNEKIKKLEKELSDLEKWIQLKLVGEKDLKRHEQELKDLRKKIEEEKQRLIALKETGNVEEYPVPRKPAQKQLYEQPSISDIDNDAELSETDFDTESHTMEMDHSSLFDLDINEEGKSSHHREYDVDEDPYSEKNRWKRSTEFPDPDNDDTW